MNDPASTSSARPDTLSALGTHVSALSARVTRLTIANRIVQSALTMTTPLGISRLDWIVRQLTRT